jgi:hypothetical protein
MRASSWPSVLLLSLALIACGTDDGVEGESSLPADAAADSLTPQQQRARRDSAVARSGLPGAEGVGRALDASEAARARAQATDTMLD